MISVIMGKTRPAGAEWRSGMNTFGDSIMSRETSQTIEQLIKSLLDMEECGDLTDEDVDECVYYLQKVTDIAGIEVDYNELMEYET